MTYVKQQRKIQLKRPKTKDKLVEKNGKYFSLNIVYQKYFLLDTQCSNLA
jgi:hypothetical protein